MDLWFGGETWFVRQCLPENMIQDGVSDDMTAPPILNQWTGAKNMMSRIRGSLQISRMTDDEDADYVPRNDILGSQDDVFARAVRQKCCRTIINDHEMLQQPLLVPTVSLWSRVLLWREDHAWSSACLTSPLLHCTRYATSSYRLDPMQ